ncbi:hypothetical protein [Enterococcus phage ZXL]|uniref:Uncharacterized protein n=1 Tax=Enterococcus phage LY0322 TaxID=2172042 RepID=A0A2S1GSD6_9CAUD|nr:tail length tape measure protein [Enterococcus phage LY0322]AWD92293.1 hypothetical protein [Enterococcus phage LY0322]UVA48300.1 hypothetical protein [Enterococcus phage ZXL]
MIKRETHLFHTQVSLQEYLDQMGDDETLAQYAVYDGMHYIITETTITDEEAKQLRIKELEKQLDECNTKYNKEIEECERYMYDCKVQLKFKKSYYWQKCRDELIEEYNKEQRKLTKQLDKLKYPDYTGFIE